MNDHASIATCLGDGLYAEFDGFMFTLKAPREDGEHFVCLEPEVLTEFERFVQRCRMEGPKAASAAPAGGVSEEKGMEMAEEAEVVPRAPQEALGS